MGQKSIFVVRVLLGVSASLALSTAGWAQTATSGAIAGQVTDASNAVLPGVTVEAASPALIEQVRIVVTDGQGRYNIVNLRPGAYVVTFSLPGFNTYQREGIELTSGFTAAVDAALTVGTLEETITVTGATPVVDVQNVRQQNLLTRDTLDAVPTGKSIQGYASITPGVVISSSGQDVGGNRGEFAGALAIHGGRQNDQHLWIDGMRQNIGYTHGGGTHRLYMSSQATIQEVNFTTGGMNAESSSGGIQINIVPKEGSNTFNGTYHSDFANTDLQMSNFSDDLRNRGLSQPPGIRTIYDHGGSLGGPIVRDRLWFMTAHRWWGASEFAPGNFFDATPHGVAYTADLDRPAFTDIYNRDNTIRLTWQAANNQKISLNSSHQSNCLCYYTVDRNNAPEAITHQVYDPVHLQQLSWTSPFTNRLLLEAGFTYGRNGVHWLRPPGVTRTDIPIREQSTGYRSGAGAGIRFWVPGSRPAMDQVNMKFSVSYVTGSHNFKAGVFGFRARTDLATEAQDVPAYTFRNGVPVSATFYASPRDYSSRAWDRAFYVQDQWSLSDVTLNLGVRFDSLYGWNPEQTRPASAFTPEFHFAEETNVPNFKDITPRLGVVYDVFGDGRTAIKATLSKYVQGDLAGYAIRTNKANAISDSATRGWNDVNGDFIPQESELGPSSNSNFGTLQISRNFAEDVLAGWNTRPNSWQGSVSVQHELTPGVSMTASYFRTWYGNFTVTDNLAVTSADFDQYCITGPTDSRLPDGGGSEICGLFDVSTEKFGAVDNLVTLASNFGKRTEVYNGIDFTVNARFGEGGQFAGGVSTGRTATDDCDLVANLDNPSQRFCQETNPWAAQTQLKFNVVYPLPYGVQASSVFQYLPGVNVSASYVARNSEIAPSLGRNLASCGTGGGACSRSASVTLIEPFSNREERLTQLDLRFTKFIEIDRFRLRGMFDIYNVMNASTVLSANSRFGSAWLQPQSILAGRIFKFGGQVDF